MTARLPPPVVALADRRDEAELQALRWRVERLERELQAVVDQLARQRRTRDSRLPGVLAMIHRFALAKPWSAAELLDDARHADRDLWGALDSLVGDRGDPAVRLGLWLHRHVDADGDGLILTRVRKERGAWLYAVQPVEE